MKNQKRSLTRRNLTLYLDIVDDTTMLQFGHVIDISETGMRIISSENPGEGVTRHCTIMLPESLEHLEDLRVTATCRWVAPDTNPDFLAAGFEFKSLTGMEKLIVQEILKTQTFDE